MRSRKYKYCRWRGKRMRKHVAIYLEWCGLDRLPDGYVVHHIDFNKTNNHIANLSMITKRYHDSIHARNRRRNRYGRFV